MGVTVGKNGKWGRIEVNCWLYWTESKATELTGFVSMVYILLQYSQFISYNVTNELQVCVGVVW